MRIDPSTIQIYASLVVRLCVRNYSSSADAIAFVVWHKPPMTSVKDLCHSKNSKTELSNSCLWWSTQCLQQLSWCSASTIRIENRLLKSKEGSLHASLINRWQQLQNSFCSNWLAVSHLGDPRLPAAPAADSQFYYLFRTRDWEDYLSDVRSTEGFWCASVILKNQLTSHLEKCRTGQRFDSNVISGVVIALSTKSWKRVTAKTIFTTVKENNNVWRLSSNYSSETCMLGSLYT